MAVNIIKRTWHQNQMVKIEPLNGFAFQAESGGHTFQISGVDDSGNAVPISGTIAGVFLRPDNTDVALSGSASGGVASVTLTAECYAVPGRFLMTVYATSGSNKGTIYAAMGTVSRTTSGAVSPAAASDVVDLVNRIDAATATIPASYTTLLNAVAGDYSDTKTYAVKDFVWYNGHLYRCTTAITTAETWTAGHWNQVVLADALNADITDLKSAISSSLDYVNYFDDLIMGSLNTTTGEVQTSTNRCVNASIRSADKAVSCSCDSGYSLYVLQYNDDQSVAVLTTWVQNYTIPANVRVRIMVRKNDNANVSVEEIKTHASGVYSVIPEIDTRITTLENDVSDIDDRVMPEIDTRLTVLENTVSDIDDRFSPDKNLFDGAWERGSFANDGAEITGAGAYRTGYIPVKPNTVYTLQNEVSGADPYFVGLIIEYSADHAFVYRHANTTVFPYTFTTQPSTAYIRFRTKDTASVTIAGAQNAKYMLHTGNGIMEYLPYGSFTMADGFSIDVNDNTFGKYNQAVNWFDWSAQAQANDGSADSRFDADAMTAQDVYDAYDSLVSAYPAYVTKKDLGVDASGEYHIYQYTFAPPTQNLINSSTGQVLDATRHCLQKLLITTGTHGNSADGDHTDSIISTFNIMKMLCQSYRGDPVLSFLHENVEIDVIPCVNPWGITNSSRRNSNNVDINRNFDAGWSASRPNAGSSAGSEAETQILQTFFDSNADATCHVEVHTRGGDTWAGTQTTFVAEVSNASVLRYAMQNVVGYLKSKFIASGSVNVDLTMHGMITDYSLKKEIPSVLLECAYMSFSTETGLHSKATDLRNTEFVADTFIKSLQWMEFHPKATVS